MAHTTLLYLKVSEGKNLPVKDLSGSSDPFCVVRIDNEDVARTPTVWRNLNPFWGEEYTLRLPGTFHNVSVYVYDEDALSKNDPIGKVLLEKSALLANPKGDEKWFKLSPIRKESEVHGEIDIKVTLVDKKEPAVLQVFVGAARELAAKDASGTSDPFLEIVLGDKKHTTSTQKRTLFPRWNQQFNFPVSLPLDTSQKFEFTLWDWDRLCKNDFMGQFEISFVNLEAKRSYRAWHQLQPRKTSPSAEEDPNLGSIRLTVRCTETIILSTTFYDPLKKLLVDAADKIAWEEKEGDGASVYDVIEEAARTNLNEIATNLVKFYLGANMITTYLEGICQRDIDACDHPATLFRGNSLGTKSVDQFMKVVGTPFLCHVVKPVICSIFEENKLCEIDSSKLDGKDKESVLTTSESLLRGYVSSMMNSMLKSVDSCPKSMRVVFKQLFNNVTTKFATEDKNMGYLAISSFLFLRYFTAAVLSPKLFGLHPTHPGQRPARTLTLIAKVMQKIGNFASSVNSKEQYMACLEPFIAENIPKFRAYIDDLISLDADKGTFILPKRAILSPTTPMLSGYLRKRRAESLTGRLAGSKLANPFTLKTRYFWLSQIALAYGKTEKDERRKSIDIQSVCAVERLDATALNRKHVIQVLEKNPSDSAVTKTMYIQMKDVNELNEWLSAIRKACLLNRRMLEFYHPGLYRNSKWSCCREAIKGIRGCSRVHSAVLSDWRDPLDPEAELELIYLQLRFGVEAAEKKYSDAESAVRDVVQVVRNLEGEHRKQKARSGGSIAVENAYGL